MTVCYGVNARFKMSAPMPEQVNPIFRLFDCLLLLLLVNRTRPLKLPTRWYPIYGYYSCGLSEHRDRNFLSSTFLCKSRGITAEQSELLSKFRINNWFLVLATTLTYATHTARSHRPFDTVCWPFYREKQEKQSFGVTAEPQL